MTEKRIVYITDVCSSIFAGGDAPKKHFSFEQTEECCYPVFSNGESHNGLYGYTNTARVTEPSITVSARGTIGFTAIRLTPFTPIVRLISITPIQDIIDIDYLYYALSNYTPENTGTSIPQLTVPMIKKYKFRLPEKDEQKRAVKTLKQLDDILEKGKIQIQKLDELVKSRFVELFSSDYPEYTLLDLCNIIDYRGKTPEKVESGLPFITAKNVKMHYMSLVPREYISKETYDKVMVRGFPKEGDVVFTTEAPLGNVCRIPHFNSEFYIGQRIVTLQTEKLEPIYLEYALTSDSFIKKYRNKSSGSTVTGIRVRLLEQLTIPVPPINLQTQFADFVTKVEQQKTIAQKSIDKLETLKKSLMQEYFG